MSVLIPAPRIVCQYACRISEHWGTHSIWLQISRSAHGSHVAPTWPLCLLLFLYCACPALPDLMPWSQYPTLEHWPHAMATNLNSSQPPGPIEILLVSHFKSPSGFSSDLTWEGLLIVCVFLPPSCSLLSSQMTFFCFSNMPCLCPPQGFSLALPACSACPSPQTLAGSFS